MNYMRHQTEPFFIAAAAVVIVMMVVDVIVDICCLFVLACPRSVGESLQPSSQQQSVKLTRVGASIFSLRQINRSALERCLHLQTQIWHHGTEILQLHQTYKSLQRNWEEKTAKSRRNHLLSSMFDQLAQCLKLRLPEDYSHSEA